jgi:membrane carboxypeptidase/penicillin-binding protein PbpC
MKVYIAGKITGEQPENYFAKFSRADKLLRSVGFETANPVLFNIRTDASHTEAMRVCLPILNQCNAIYVLSCHPTSKGTKTEIAYAKKIGLPVFYEEDKGIVELVAIASQHA